MAFALMLHAAGAGAGVALAQVPQPTPGAPPAKSSAASGGRRDAGAKGAAGPAKRRQPGVRGMFDAAQELYAAGRYPEALAAFDAILKKYPAHEPSIQQMAKALYRLDRFREAYAFYARLSPATLDPETTYEYGWTFYTAKSYEGALAAFQRLPKGHALYDLANYYGAICAIKLKRYDVAEEMLDKAVVLPDKLAKSRTLYVKHVQALRLLQQRSALGRERDREKLELEAERKRKKKEAEEAAAKETVAGYKHQGLRGVTKEAAVAYAAEHQYIDDHGFKQSAFDAKVASFSLKSGPVIPLPIKVGKDRQAAYGLELRLSAEDRVQTGDEQILVTDQSDQDVTRVLSRKAKVNGETGTANGETKSGTFGGETWLEFPLPEGVWLALGGELEFTYPEFARGQREGFRRGFLGVGGRAGAVNYAGEGSYTEVVNEKTKPITNIVTADVTLSGELLAKLTAALDLTYKVFDYPRPELELDGPDEATSGEVSLKQDIPYGFSITGTVDYERQTNAVFHGLPTYGEVAADGDLYTGKLILAAAPFSFVSASLEEDVTQKKWKVQNEAARETFEVNTPDYVESFTAKISLNLAF
jgi:tetratricopeptide (TPR) repeat protein